LGVLSLSADGSSDRDASFKPPPGVDAGMDDALRRRLDRLTWLVGGLFVAVLALGFYQGGAEYLVTFLAVLVVAVVLAGALVLPSLVGAATGEDA